MRPSKLAISVTAFLVIWLVGLGVTTAQVGSGKVKWERIVGFTPRVGSGSALTFVGGVESGIAPWTATRGQARINLRADRVTFEVKGLVLAGNPPPDGVLGAPQPDVTTVKGTLVCDSQGTPSTFDTGPVPLSAQGNADFQGTVSLPAVCMTPAFLIRPATGSLVDKWIAHGAVRTP